MYEDRQWTIDLIASIILDDTVTNFKKDYDNDRYVYFSEVSNSEKTLMCEVALMKILELSYHMETAYNRGKECPQ